MTSLFPGPMAHYIVYQTRIGPPFASIRELKMVIAAGVRRRQASRYPKMMLILHGSCHITLRDGFSTRLEAGDLLLVPCPCHHIYHGPDPQRDAELYVLLFHFEHPPPTPGKRLPPWETQWRTVLDTLLAETRHVPAALTAAMRLQITTLREEYRSSLPGSLVRQRLLAQDLVIEAARRLGTAPPTSRREGPGASRHPKPNAYRSQAFLVCEIKEYLGKTVERRHTLSQIAWHFHLSEEHLARLFKRETGLTVMAFLRRIKIDAARTLLLSTRETIASLAARLGFSSSNHFCRAFVAETGLRPMEYRERHAGVNDPYHASLRAK